jgi:hypothetical protein
MSHIYWVPPGTVTPQSFFFTMVFIYIRKTKGRKSKLTVVKVKGYKKSDLDFRLLLRDKARAK